MKTIHGVGVLTEIQELVDPDRCAVLVVDMINEDVSPEGGYAKHGADISRHREIVPRIGRLLEATRGIGIQVIYAEFIHMNQLGHTLMNGPEMWMHRNAAWVSNVVEGSWESQTIDELAPQEGDIVIRKSRGSTAYNTYLVDFLKGKSIQSLLLTGIASSGCVLRTAVDLMPRGYYAVIVKDCVDHKDWALAFLERNFPAYHSDEILHTWKRMSNTQRE